MIGDMATLSLSTVSGLSEDGLRFACVLHMKGGAKVETTLYRDERHHCWRLRAMVDGKRVSVATRVPGTSRADLALAREQATQLLQRRWDGEFQSTREAAREAQGLATFEELARAYSRGIRQRTGIEDDTISRSVTSMRMILREVGVEMDASSGVLDGEAGGELVRRFQHLRLKAVPSGASEEELGRARRSIDGALNKARALFTPAAMEIYRQEGMKLPELGNAGS